MNTRLEAIKDAKLSLLLQLRSRDLLALLKRYFAAFKYDHPANEGLHREAKQLLKELGEDYE